MGITGVNWNGNNWALKCDFTGNDLKSVSAQGEQCGSLCASTSGCTHWSFTNANGGTCYLKQGSVSKNNAIYSSDPSASCGVNEDSTNPGENTTKNPGQTNAPVTAGSALAKLTSCKFAYGRDWKDENTDYSPYDYITIWINTPKENCKGDHCTDFNKYYQGVMLNKCKQLGKTPVFYAYIIAFESRVAWGLKDCNMGYPNLCQRGSKYIRENRDRIIERYSHHSAEIAGIIGRDAFSVFNIEADFHQYYGDDKQEGGTLSGEEMRSLFDDIVTAIKSNLPNAAIGLDISPWIGDWNMKKWWSYFASSSDIDFITTSGGGSQGGSSEMIPGQARWKFMHDLTGKPIIGDTGYGVGGAADSNSGPWYQNWNIDNRINDGVCAVSIANANRSPSHRPNIC